jgi:8-oxo-dGTP diphosphatase
MKKYVSLLKFSADYSKVVTMTKEKPAFLAGKETPVGGEQEEGETPEQAVIREFEEETGVSTIEGDWTLYATSTTNDSEMHCFYSASDDFVNCRTTTSEPILISKVEDVLMRAISNPDSSAPDMVALIGLALQHRFRPGKVLIDYSGERPKPTARPR